MKKQLLATILLISFCGLNAQVTQINANKSLEFNYPLSNTKQIFVSATDSSIWATDGTLAGTIQLSPTIKFVEGIGSITFLNGKYIFSGTTAATGPEVYITDGTIGGTVLVKDINAGTPGSNPSLVGQIGGSILFTATTPTQGDELWKTDGTPGGTSLVKDINPGVPGSSIDRDVAYLNGFLFFTAVTAAEGREIWKTDGSAAGTTLLKDIVPGTGDSNYPDKYLLTSTPTYLLFDARTPSSGVELWKSDGTTGGTALLKDINPGIDSSNARGFSIVNGVVLFEATDATDGDEIWKTNGTTAGTTILKDINPGAGSSTQIFFVVINYPIFQGFHIFNNKAYFTATDGTSVGEMWSTDGTTANTVLVKNIVQSTSIPPPLILVTAALNLPNKFIFSVTDLASRSELWESDGTPVGTVLFKAFSPPTMGSFPIIFPPANFTNGSLTQTLFQGNKFFFSAGTTAEGNELWISDGVDGTVAHTHIVKDINPGSADSDPALGSSYLYTTNELFFAANVASLGLELWRSDGTNAGTNLVKDINPGSNDADPILDPFILNGKILFGATDGDDATETDLFVVNGSFTALPIKLLDFTVTPKGNDALLAWNTSQELNTKNFTVQRSYDAQHFEDIGSIQATGTSYNGHAYTFIDPGIIKSGRSIVYYRLSASDIDGKSVTTNVISLKLRGGNHWNVQILSNPVKDNVNLLLTDVTGKLQLTIRDVSGKTFYTRTMENTNGQVSLPAPSQKGIYILESENNNERKTIKFIR